MDLLWKGLRAAVQYALPKPEHRDEIKFIAFVTKQRNDDYSDSSALGLRDMFVEDNAPLKIIKWKEIVRDEAQDALSPWLVPIREISGKCSILLDKSKCATSKDGDQLEKFLQFADMWSRESSYRNITGWIECPEDIIGDMKLSRRNNLEPNRLSVRGSVSFGTWKNINTFTVPNYAPNLTDVRIEIRDSERDHSILLYFELDGKTLCLEWKDMRLIQDAAITCDAIYLTMNRNPFLFHLQSPARVRHPAHNARTSLATADRYSNKQKWTKLSLYTFRNVSGYCDVIGISDQESPTRLGLAKYLLRSQFSGDKNQKRYSCRFLGMKSDIYDAKFVKDLSQYEVDDAYLYEVLQSHGLKISCKINTQLFKWLVSSDKAVIALKWAFVKKMIDQAQMNTTEWFRVTFDFDIPKEASKWDRLKFHTFAVKKAIITPSLVRFLPPQQTEINRILKENKSSVNSFMNVSFRYEDFLQKMENAPDALIIPTIGDRLFGGLEVCGRTFRFLGGSASQLREHACYLHTIDKFGVDSFVIRENIGDLSMIRNRATYVKRLGMGFSSSKGERPYILPPSCVIRIEEDIKQMNPLTGHEYCFSDGIGRISWDTAKEINRCISDNHRCPSAFQVRLGGAKGVLAVDPSLHRKAVVLRDSMVKFQSEDRTVYVQSTSSAKQLRLNHQIVPLLSEQGIPDEVFYRLQEESMDRILEIFWNTEAAKRELVRMSPYLSWDTIFGVTDNALLRRILAAIVEKKMHSIVYKTQINIQNGHQLMGVLDEKGVLQDGEIYFKTHKTSFKPFEGAVVVSKMPALHPGDVRRFRAVNKPQLSHLQDVVVFPKKGPRPHPDEMAGSDLDGDLYWITWHNDIVQSFRKSDANYPAMEFASQPAQKQDGAVQEKDMIDYIIHQIQTDVTSKVASAHKRMADREGIFSEGCLKLAELHSRAVDAPKTGEKVFVPDELMLRQYPDFLDKTDHKETYTSERILGKLFRQYVDLYKALRDLKYQVKPSICYHEPQNIHGKPLQLAGNIIGSFKKEFGELQAKYQLGEVELLTGNVFHSKIRNNSQDFRTFQLEIQLAIKTLFTKFTSDVEQTMQDEANKNINKEIAEAAYHIHCQEEDGNMSCYPWLFAKWLPETSQFSSQSQNHQFVDADKKTGGMIRQWLKDWQEKNKSFKPFFIGCKDESISIFQQYPWLCMVFIYYSVVLMQVDQTNFDMELTDLLINVSVSKQIVDQHTVDKCRNQVEFTGIFQSFVAFFKDDKPTQLNKAIINALDDYSLEANIGNVAIDVLWTSLHLSDNSNPLSSSLNRIHQANSVVDVLVKGEPLSLLKSPDLNDTTTETITINPKIAEKLFSAGSQIPEFEKLGVIVRLENGTSLIVTGHKLVLRKLKYFVEQLNRKAFRNQAHRTSRQSQQTVK